MAKVTAWLGLFPPPPSFVNKKKDECFPWNIYLFSGLKLDCEGF